MKSKLFFALVLSVLLLLCACNMDENQISSAESSFLESLSDKSTSDEYSASESSALNSEESEIYEMFLTCEIPAFSDAERTRLPLYSEKENTWCVNIGDTRLSGFKQLFVQDETAKQLASAISLIDSDKLRNLSDFSYFDNISNANTEYMLFAALNAAPFVFCSGEYYDSTWTAIVENPKNIISQLSKYFFEELHIYVERAYYADDVEKTFHYLFGESTEFSTEKVPAGYRYIPEEKLFIATEDNYINLYSLPQIVSYTKKDSKYYVEAVDSQFYFTPAGEFDEGVTADDILAGKHINYTFEKAKDGHFVLCGISATE